MVVTLLPELALGAGLVVGIMLCASGQLSIGALVAFFATAAVIASPVEFSGMLLAMALTAKTAVDRHYEVMDSANTITSPPEPRRPDNLAGALEFHNPPSPTRMPRTNPSWRTSAWTSGPVKPWPWWESRAAARVR